MTAHSVPADPLARALTPFVRELLLEEVRRHAAADRQAKADEIDEEIMGVSIAVARASDRLAAARFSGAPEADAHRKLVKATAALSVIMRKHGRMPRGK